MAARLRLKFELIECRGCHGERERGLACPECGAKPDAREVDQERLKRVRLVRTVREAWERATHEQGLGRTESELLDVAGDTLESFMAGLDEALAKSDPSQALGSAGSLGHWMSDVESLRRRRPTTRQYDLIQTIAQHWRGAADSLLSALEGTISQAQRYERRVQRHIDAAGEAVAADRRLGEAQAAPEGQSFLQLAESVLKVELLKAGQSLGEFLASTTEDLSELLGVADVDPIAVDVALFEGLGQLVFDIDNYKRCLLRAWQLVNKPGLLRQIVDNSECFLEDLTEAWITLALRTWGTGQALDNAMSERVAVEEMVALSSTLVDRPGAFVARALLLLAGVRQQDYDKMRLGNATEDIPRAGTDARLAPLVASLDARLRTAHSHDGVRYRAGGVSTHTKQHGKDEYAAEDILDALLGAIEGVHATLCALRLALSVAGIEFDEQPVRAAFGVSMTELSVLQLSLASGLKLSLESNDDVLALVAYGPYQPGVLTTLAHEGLSLSPTATRLEIRLVCGADETFEFSGPAEPMRSQHLASPDPLVLLEGLSMYTLNGEPALSHGMVRGLGVPAVWNFDGESGGASALRLRGARLRRLLEIARRMEDQHLVSFLRLCLQEIRTGKRPADLVIALQSCIDAGVRYDLP